MDERKRRVSPLVNALWGSDSKPPPLPVERVRRLRWGLVGVTLLAATGVGIFVAIVDDPAAGAVAALVTAVLMGGVSRATFRDWTEV